MNIKCLILILLNYVVVYKKSQGTEQVIEALINLISVEFEFEFIDMEIVCGGLVFFLSFFFFLFFSGILFCYLV